MKPGSGRFFGRCESLGSEHPGLYLSCRRDFAFLEGFNPRLKLTRTKAIMEGADICDFRYEDKE